MDYVFSFRKFASLQTARNDYPRIYRVLRTLNAIPQSGPASTATEEEYTMDVLVRQDNFPRDLLLESQGLKAFMKQKRATIETEMNKMDVASEVSGAHSDVAIDMLGEVHGHIAIVDTIITKLKVLCAVLQTLSKKRASSITSDCSTDQLRLLRERAVKYRMFFDELRQNREDVDKSLQRYTDELSWLRNSCMVLKDWLEAELSRLSGATVSIVC
jgi:hypothetical protein